MDKNPKDKVPLPTSQEVYDRIRWDPGYDGRWFHIGYEDREEGLCEIAFLDFAAGGEIPWHRIRYFRIGDTKVWDREKRIYLLPQVRSSQGAMASQGDPSTRPNQAVAEFGDRAALLLYLQGPPPGRPVWALCRLDEEYPSFVMEACIHLYHRGPDDNICQLAIEWRSYAMDWMGDATHARVVYEFDSLDEGLTHLQDRYGVHIADLTRRPPPLPQGTPLVNSYPEPLVSVFQGAWRRLRADFSSGRALEPGLRVVHKTVSGVLHL